MTQPYPDLAELLSAGGSIAMIHVDLSDAADRPASELDLRRRAVVEQLQAAGASNDDIAALTAAFVQHPGADGPLGLIAAARGGQLVLEQLAPGQPPARDTSTVTDLPDLTPVLRARETAIRFVLVEADAQGGRVHVVEAAGLPDADGAVVQGSTEHIHEARTGGNAHHRHAHTVENTWNANAGEVAAEAAREAEAHAAQLIVITGDPHVAQLVQEQLPEFPRVGVAVLGRDTIAAGADEGDASAVAQFSVDRLVDGLRARALDAAAADSGSAGAVGVAAVVAALQEARVDTLLISGEPDELLALGTAPWVAVGEEDALAAPVIGRVAGTAALSRAAILTDAFVRFPAPDRMPDGAPVAAALRWSESAADA